MINGGDSYYKNCKLEDVITDQQLKFVTNNVIKDKGLCGDWQVVGSDVKPAAVGLAGFLGDHVKAGLVLRSAEKEVTHSLFIKSMPKFNKPKAEFITSNNYFKREMIMFKVFEEIGGADGSWHPKSYLCDENVLAMPDLTLEGYATRDKLSPFDLDHILLTVHSVARFHAAFINYENRKLSTETSFFEEHKTVLGEPIFFDSPWIHAGAKLTVNFLNEFSSKYKSVDESKLTQFYLNICNSFRDCEENTINVAVHKDLWSNNIMFRYEDDKPVNAVLIDYQCIRYGPPTFDLMICIYLNTSRKLRDDKNTIILRFYYEKFFLNLNTKSKEIIGKYDYSWDNFLIWCEKCRPYGLLVAAMIFPYVLMDGSEANDVFNDPETYEKRNNEDRTEPVLEHASKVPVYKERILEILEEVVEMYLDL